MGWGPERRRSGPLGLRNFDSEIKALLQFRWGSHFESDLHARDLGANRQNVQRIVNELEQEGLLRFENNPHHKRAQLVVLTAVGKRAYDDAIRAWDPAADDLARGLSPDELATALRVLSVLRSRLAASHAREVEADA